MALDEFRKSFGKVLMELIGTAVLVLTIQMTAAGNIYGPIAVGLVLAIVVYCGKPLSGGHYNPAVSFSILLRGSLSIPDLVLYWVFQLIGAFCGGLLGKLMSGQSVAPVPGAEYHALQAYLCEFVFTALLCFVVLATCTNSSVDGNSYYGAAIGLTVFVGIVAAGPISGGVFNPAVAIALGILAGHIWYMIWIVVFQMLGGLAGACLFYLVAPDVFGRFAEEAHRVIGEATNLLPQRG